MLFKMSRSKQLLMLLGLLTTTFAVMYSTIFQVINYNIYAAFPESLMAVNFFISGPYILVMLVSFISPAIYTRTNRKTMLLLSCAVFTASALLFTRQTNIYGFITVNLICGAASAYINVSAATMIVELFVDEQLKAKYLGFYNAAMSATGSIFSVIAGYLARENWVGAFNTYWSAAIMTLLAALFIPNLPKSLFDNTGKEDCPKKERGGLAQLGPRFWVLTLNFIVLGITYFVPGFFLSLYIAEHSLGDITYAGVALSVDTLGGAIFALFFSRTYRRFKSYSSVAAFLLMSLVLLLLYLFPHRVLLVVIVTLMGGSYMTTICYGYQESSRVVPKACLPLATGIIVGVQYISTFLATYITTGLMRLLGTDQLTPTLIFPVCWILAFAALEYFSIKKYEKRPAAPLCEDG